MARILADFILPAIEALQEEERVIVKETLYAGAGRKFWAMAITPAGSSKALIEYGVDEEKGEVFLRVGEEKRTLGELKTPIYPLEQKAVEIWGEALSGLRGFLKASQEATLHLGSPVPPWLADARNSKEVLIAKGTIGKELADILDEALNVSLVQLRFLTFYGREGSYRMEYEVLTATGRKVYEVQTSEPSSARTVPTLG